MRPYRQIVLKEVAAVLGRVGERGTKAFAEELSRAKRVYITGVGRSGLVVKAFGQRLMHMGWEVHLADEITAPGIRRGDILIACSGTGTTQLPLYMARKARKIGARTIAITARARSPLSRLANRAIVIPAPLEARESAGGVRSRQPARSLFEQAMFLYLDSLILTLMHEFGITSRKLARRHANLE